jgi:Protein of unknown function (DUF1697)
LGVPVATFAAFFRNTNLGRLGSPSKQQFESAFSSAGGVNATSFQVNGTLIFEAQSLRRAQSILSAAALNLRADCGLIEPACVRALKQLAALPFKRVFEGTNRALVHELTVSFACGQVVESPATPFANSRRDAEVLWLENGNALSITRKLMSGPGSPNRLLEQVTGVPFTSRSILTLERLLARYHQPLA